MSGSFQIPLDVLHADIVSEGVPQDVGTNSVRKLAIDYSFAYTPAEFGQALKLISDEPEN
ncbi:hypothetical protein ACTJJ7_12195 [Phyllobacterium sp. 22229]|uniref:Uncharacterized protein n=1 Tax=Agrobacterium radiobacter TaxID=362 RepID=A0ABD5LMW0_AGRRD